MTDLSPQAIRPLIRRALEEDAASRDATSRAVIPATLRIRARILAKAHGVAAGSKVAALIFTTLDPSLRCRLHVHSAATVSPAQPILTVEGRARSIFAAERAALNLLGHLSGIATLTAAYVRQVRGTRAQIFDTRKTLPGLRALERYAVRAGGGHNHRTDLAGAILIKTNHLRAIVRGGTGNGERGMGNVIQEAIERARRARPKRVVEIEVTTVAELRAALEAGPDAVLLDNWHPQGIRRAVRMARGAVFRSPFRVPLVEVSGGVTLANVRAIAKTGVDRISVGRLTHSAPALNVSLTVI